MEKETQTQTRKIPEIFDTVVENAEKLDTGFKNLDKKETLSEEQRIAIEYQTYVVKNKISELDDEINTLMIFLDTVGATDTEEQKKRLEDARDYESFLKFMAVLYSYVTYSRSI